MQKIPVTAFHPITPGLPTAAHSFDGDLGTSWFPGWSAGIYPARIVVDLGRTCRLAHVKVYDGTGRPKLNFFSVTDAAGANSRPLANFNLDLYNMWQEREVSAETRFVLIELVSAEGDKAAPEIEFWGQYLDGGPVTPPPPPNPGPVDPNPPAPPVTPLRSAFVGTNAFHWVPWAVLEPFPFVRQYQMAEWTWTPEGIAVEPSHRGNANYDTYFAEARRRGIEVAPCINRAPEWFNPVADAQMTDPDDRGAPNRADAYTQWAAYLWQVAARYGRKTHPAASLRVNTTPRWNGDPVNEKKSGLGLLRYMEPENETNRWWRPVGEQYTPEQAAAMLSAAYDGHCGALGAGHGIKAGDPTMLVVMPGLADINVPYLDAMFRWAQHNRADGRFPADILNVHHYTNTGNQPGNPRVNMTGAGCEPEADNLRGRLADLVRWRDAFMPGTPVWFSEFGYDTHQNSPQRAVPHAQRDAETAQGLWLVRSYLEAAAAGVDKCFLFNAIDEPGAANGGLFTSCGIARGENAGFVKKKAHDQIAALSTALAGRSFAADLSIGPDMRLYLFTGAAAPALIGWCATDTGQTMTIRIGGQPFLLTEIPTLLTIA